MAFERRVGTVLQRMAGVFLLFVGVVAVLSPRDANIPYSRWRVVLLVSVLGAGALATAALRSRSRRRPDPSTWRLVSSGVTVAGTAVCTVLAWALRYDTGWDAGTVAGMSQRLMNGHDLTASMYGYLSKYPNNLPLLALDNACAEVARLLHVAPGAVSVTLNGLALAVSMQAVYWLVAMLRGPASGVAAQLLVLALVGISPWMTVPYTDVVSMPLVVLGTALTVAVPRRRPGWPRVWCATSAAVCLLVAYELKTTPVVSAVALVMVLTSEWRSTSGATRRLLAAGALAALLLLTGGAALAGQVAPAVAGVSAERIDGSQTPPTLWWVYMGASTQAKDGVVRYGGYDASIVRATRRMDAVAADRYAAAGLHSRLSELGVVGYARFLADKSAWNWGDGMFWAWGEGDDLHRPALVHGPLTDAVRSWNHPSGRWYAARAALAEAIWVLLLLGTGRRLLRAAWRWDTGLLVLSVLGIAAFTLAFQGRSRYLLAYVPVVVALATSLPPSARRSSPGADHGHGLGDVLDGDVPR